MTDHFDWLSERRALFTQRWHATAEPARVWMRRRWRSLALLGTACAALLAFDAWLGTCGFVGCPSGSEIRAFKPGEGGRIVDQNDRYLGRIAIVRRVNVPIAEVPPFVREAFLATEDRRFYAHNGLDWRGFFRAAATNLRHGGVREGFSTITMQVARNSFLVNQRGRSLRRKLIELRLTKLIESELTKDQILELYLNVIYLGNGMNGVEAASRDLFGKHVSQLSVSEGAMLAALPKGPSAYTPRDHYERGLKRRNLVLDLMRESGYLTADQAARATSVPLRIAENEWRPDTKDEPLALDAVRVFIDSILPDALKDGDVTVYTTLDLAAQRAADRAVLRGTTTVTRETQYAGGRVPDAAQGALVALDPRTGDIRALVGGRRSKKGFNRAFNARRQPGSAFKPFVYAAALRSGMTPATLVDDEPVEIAQGRKIWRPANYDDSYIGTITIAKALAVSSNAAAVRVSQSVGIPNVIDAAHRSGITSALPNYPAMALGAVEVTPLELVAAYATFANGGLRVRPRLVRRIEAADGTVLWSAEIAAPDTVMDPRDAFQLTSMLQGVVDNGTARVVREMGVKGAVAGKTGTTNNAADVWFVGYTPSLVAGVWFGYDTPRAIAPHASGGHLAAPAWAEFYLNGWREPASSANGWQPPPGMTMRVIDPTTGLLAGQYCPVRQRQWFKPGTEPTEVCNAHYEEPAEENPWPDTLDQRIPEPVQKGVEGIGKVLRKIFRF
ncbi:MAG: PBP1A family penicillin-binding protein [Gemmatimonadaceae bacterium]|nr:PBP1A family penicillin-binding protein [Gemmatimonadaceae bacterium]NUO94443.1 PBP1A family penicillin-binding protein [Gemmatimonadaceae bacterium]NUP72770.1 PBP1A family penicillin-binding protein [Gemmatimonadaceae bacterium]NUS33759.1 PBP1A family penicillin-binding protein [Gemmatimonadaceae bacterium]